MSIAFSKQYVVERTTAKGTYVKGKYIAPGDIDITINACIQNLTAKETLILPDGQRDKQNIKIYSDEILYGSSQDKKADTVNYKGSKYEVRSVEGNTDFALPHYKSIAMKIEVDRENSK